MTINDLVPSWFPRVQAPWDRISERIRSDEERRSRSKNSGERSSDGTSGESAVKRHPMSPSSSRSSSPVETLSHYLGPSYRCIGYNRLDAASGQSPFRQDENQRQDYFQETKAIGPIITCICFELEKKDEDDPRLASDFTPQQLLHTFDQCAVCDLLLAGIRRSEQQSEKAETKGWSFTRDVSRVYMYALGQEGDSLSLELYFKNDRPKVVLEYYVKTGQYAQGRISNVSLGQTVHTDGDTGGDICGGAIKQRTSVTGFPVLPNGVEWVKSMLNSCASSHGDCASSRLTPLPSRLLKFERISDGQLSVRLVDTAGQVGTYNALSYCWGGVQECVTTEDNLAAYKRSIPWSTLSTTFRDAMLFCLELGVDMLWIDALCIVQDDTLDWHKESATMAGVFSNSYVTLAATSSTNGTGGCFSLGHQSTIEHEIETTELADRSIFVREKLKHWKTPLDRASAQSQPLLSRGWAFQERYLSNRMIHFCRRELIWECKASLVCECGSITSASSFPTRMFATQAEPVVNVPAPQAGPQHEDLKAVAPLSSQSHSTERQRKSRISDMLSRTNAEEGVLESVMISANQGQGVHIATWHGWTMRGSRQSLHQWSYDEEAPGSAHWRSLVEQYSALNLTRNTDRLPAFSGLAIRSSTILGHYTCGLWLKSLLRDLLWRVETLRQDMCRPEVYLGPSWSWAALISPVKYWPPLQDDDDLGSAILGLSERRNELRLIQRQEAMLKALSVICDGKAAGANRFGAVTSATLRVKGYTATASLNYVYVRVGLKRPFQEVHDPLHYQLTTSAGYELPFHADYVLSQGPSALLDGSNLLLLLVDPFICLVLYRKAHREAYQRIGILRYSPFLEIDGIDPMSGALQEHLRII